VTSPAREGRANLALVKILAKELCIPMSDIEILKGHRGRTKLLSLEGLTQETLRDRMKKYYQQGPST
jgi:hypothetical protein